MKTDKIMLRQLQIKRSSLKNELAEMSRITGRRKSSQAAVIMAQLIVKIESLDAQIQHVINA